MRRLVLALLAVVTVAAGLAVHRLAPEGFAGDAAGDVLYAALIVLLLALLAPHAPWWATAAGALAWCGGVELLQLTALPARWGAAFPPFRLVLGTTFSPWDLLWYVLGAALVGGADGLLRSRRREIPEHAPR
ncbi:ribosomal maturation YjgA family protein [Brachybacterium hainanense]|uniref:DUF2809 domain-containing protein n=1 Tax=Brachybacterium hainanense TaxID=1541174 RepID=A0ABV6R7N4_9MICO